MPIYASAGENKTYTPAPSGTHQAVCVDVIDIGLKPNMFREGAMQHKIDIAWQLPELRDDGKRHVVFKRYTLSLNDKATLRHDLESWRGKQFTAEELENGFDMDKLYGVNCLVGIKHEADRNDPSKIYANISAILPLPKNMEKIAALRERNEAPPKWVVEKQSQAIPEDYDFPVTESIDQTAPAGADADEDITF